MHEFKDYHVFSCNELYYLFLVNYKQLFRISHEEYELLVNNESEGLLQKFISSTLPIDSKSVIEIEPEMYGLFLNVANTCNMACTYCFASQGDYGRTKGLMSKKIARKAIDVFLSTVPEDKIPMLIFFGGEPMMAYKTIVDAIHYLEQNYAHRKIQKRIVTNATFLTEEKIDFLQEKEVSVVISIDGGAELQNKQRPLRNGLDSFKESTKNIPYLINKIPDTSIRGTYVNYDYSLTKIYSELLELGVIGVDVLPDILDENIYTDIYKILNQLEHLHDFVLDYTEENFSFPFDSFTRNIKKIFLPKFTSEYNCGVGKNILSIDIKGDVYPCHRFSSEEEYKIGNIDDEKLNLNLLKPNKNECGSCWNRNTCPHGCLYNDMSYKNDSKNPYFCLYSKKMTELSLSLCARIKPDLLHYIISGKTGGVI